MSEESITVEGVKLSEFLKDKDSIKENIERDKIFYDACKIEGVKKSYSIPKYRPHTEDNGEIKHLNNLEISLTQYDKYVIDMLKSNDYRKASILAFMKLTNEKEKISLTDMANEIKACAKKHEIPCDPRIADKFKFSFTDVRKSEFGDYIKVYRKRTIENPDKCMKFSAKSEIKNISFDKAFKLNEIKKYKTIVEVEPREIRVLPKSNNSNMPAEVEPTIAESESTTPLNSATLAQVIKKQIDGLGKNSDKSTITFTGDIHVHININK